MKKILMALVLALVSINMMALSNSKMREYARFLSDRMAYELDLSPMQYDDVYEINYDFIYSIDKVMDDVVLGYIDAIDRYYDYLDYRNDDLRYVLSNVQYNAFLNSEYFFRPVYVLRNSWNLRVYSIYNNHSFYYFDRPSGYYSYIGSHARVYYSNGYYVNRHQNISHNASAVRVRNHEHYSRYRLNDFGANVRQRNEPNRVNNYRNSNQHNRAQDPRYKSDRNKVNSPSINNRNPQPQVVRSGHR